MAVWGIIETGTGVVGSGRCVGIGVGIGDGALGCGRLPSNGISTTKVGGVTVVAGGCCCMSMVGVLGTPNHACESSGFGSPPLGSFGGAIDRSILGLAITGGLIAFASSTTGCNGEGAGSLFIMLPNGQMTERTLGLAFAASPLLFEVDNNDCSRAMIRALR